MKTARNMDDRMTGASKAADATAAAADRATRSTSEILTLSPDEYDARIAAGDTPGELARAGIVRGQAEESAETVVAGSFDWDSVYDRVMRDQEALEEPKAGKKDTRTAFEKAMDTVTDAFSTRRGRIESKVALEEARGNVAGRRTAQQELISMIQEKLVQLTGIENIAKTFDEQNILETARNKLMTELVKIGNDMKDSLGKLVGSFNAPSELAAMSEYAYNVGRGNSFMTRVISTPTMNMYLTIRDLGNASAAQVRDQAMGFMDNIFKDDLVSSGMEDITRNM
jgi:vacuolar-type H+-ATPase subunit E/Vma4